MYLISSKIKIMNFDEYIDSLAEERSDIVYKNRYTTYANYMYIFRYINDRKFGIFLNKK